MKTWEQRKLSEIAIEKLSNGIMNNQANDETGLRHINVINMYDPDKIHPEKLTFSNYDEDAVKKCNVEWGDIFLTRSSLKPEGIAESNVLLDSGRFVYDDHLIRLKLDKEKYDPFFVKLNLSGSIFKRQFIARAKTTAFTTIGQEDIAECFGLFPEKEEQEKIGTYFSNLDHLITLHQRKCEETKSLKKYMLQKMFPENGKCVPEIRFSGFSDDWEQRKFGDLYCKVSEKNDLSFGSDKIISVANMYFKEDVKDSSEEYMRTYNVMRLGDIAFEGNKSKNYAHGRFVENTIGDGIVSHVFDVFRPIAEYDLYFWKYLINNEDVMGRIMTRCTKASTMMTNLVTNDFLKEEIMVPSLDEQRKIGKYLDDLDNLITLHQRKCYRFIDIVLDAWEQRKLDNVAEFSKGRGYSKGDLIELGTPIILYGRLYTNYETSISDVDTYVEAKDGAVYSRGGEVIVPASGESAEDIARAATVDKSGILLGGDLNVVMPNEDINSGFLAISISNGNPQRELAKRAQGKSVVHIHNEEIRNLRVPFPIKVEQNKIVEYFFNLDHLITLHQHKLFCAKNVMKYITTDINTPKKEAIMAELESVIEQKLIEQLIYGDSQWTYREDLKTEADLWKNFRYILEQNNKERLNGEPLSDAEFEQVKNQLQFSSFYKAGEWLVGENGKVMVHVQRDTERLHLVVMNHEHIAGGSSVYEVINQYNALKMDEDSSVNARDRRFDVTLMINGLPMIHIELKNKQHSYMDGFWQIKKYIGEGKFTGIFSAVQMFVISNGVDTKYFSAASDTELNPKFISGWLDKENNAVSDYLVFAKSVLRIPEAHEMIARYTVLDEEAKRLILLRPYQIHAIEAIRDASKTGKSGFVWHTTGSGKTLTSYKATRNLLMDIPAIDKAIFLIDRKDLDTQTTMAFQAYANNDLIDVDETDNVFDLKKKLKSDDRQVIVTTIQKLQRLITRKLQEGTPEYHKIKNLKIAFVVDDERVIIRTKLEKPSKINGLALI